MVRKHIYVFLVILIALMSCEKEEAKKVISVDFEELSVPSQGYWNGSDGSGSFTLEGIQFSNNFTDWGGGITSWSGFAYSTMTNVDSAGYANQYSTFAGSGYNSSSNFLVGCVDFFGGNLPTLTYVDADNGFEPIHIWVTNTTYAALSMKNGDFVAKKFGGESGDDPDWFELMIIGIGMDDQPTDTIECFLADYRLDSEEDYIQKDWKAINIAKLGRVKAIQFSLASSDVGDYGMNTPAYFCIDQFSYLIDND